MSAGIIASPQMPWDIPKVDEPENESGGDAGNGKFWGHYAVHENNQGKNQVSLRANTANGGYFVNWGDGNIDHYDSYEVATHTYDYNDIPAEQTSTMGFRWVTIKVEHELAYLNHLLGVNLQHTNPTGELYWLDIAVKAVYMTDLTIGGEIINRKLKTFIYYKHNLVNALNQIGDFTALFKNCVILDKAVGRDVENNVYRSFTDNGWLFGSMFSGCKKLRKVPVMLNIGGGSDISYMFENCVLLRSLYDMYSNFPYTYAARNFTGFLKGCTGLMSLPLLDTHNGINFSYMLEDCSNLMTIPLIDTHNGQNFTGMFKGCTRLGGIHPVTKVVQTVPVFNTVSALNLTSMFEGCSYMLDAPHLNTPNVTTFDKMYKDCLRLTTVLIYGLPSGISFKRMLEGCQSLTSTTIVFTNATASDALDKMFYKSRDIGGLISGGGLFLYDLKTNLNLSSLGMKTWEIEAMLNNLNAPPTTPIVLDLQGNPGSAFVNSSLVSNTRAMGWTILI